MVLSLSSVSLSYFHHYHFQHGNNICFDFTALQFYLDSILVQEGGGGGEVIKKRINSEKWQIELLIARFLNTLPDPRKT